MRRVAVRGVVWRRVMGLVVARLVGRLVVVLSLLRLQVGRGHGAHQHHHLQRIRWINLGQNIFQGDTSDDAFLALPLRSS